MHSTRRTCQLALRNYSHVSRYVHGGRRAFSVTCARPRGALPVFLEPSTPKLSSLLATLNSKILLPEHLTKEQQQLVFSKANRAKIEAEPIEITLGDVTLPLEHLDQNKLPSRWETIRDIISESKSPSDWENVVRMLEGLENAGIEVKTEWQSKIVRQLNRYNMHHLVLKALQRAKATGLRMRDYGVLRQILRGIHNKAAAADWSKEETVKSLRLAEQVAALLEDDEHCGSATGKLNFASKPVVISIPTEMAAVLADKYDGDVEKVKAYAGRLVAALKQDNYTAELDTIVQKSKLTEADFRNGAIQSSYFHDLLKDLNEGISIWNALRTARKVLGADVPMATEAQQFESRLSQTLKQGIEGAANLQKRGKMIFSANLYNDTKDAIAKCQ